MFPTDQGKAKAFKGTSNVAIKYKGSEATMHPYSKGERQKKISHCIRSSPESNRGSKNFDLMSSESYVLTPTPLNREESVVEKAVKILYSK